MAYEVKCDSPRHLLYQMGALNSAASLNTRDIGSIDETKQRQGRCAAAESLKVGEVSWSGLSRQSHIDPATNRPFDDYVANAGIMGSSLRYTLIALTVERYTDSKSSTLRDPFTRVLRSMSGLFLHQQ